METRLPADLHCKVVPPDGPPLRLGSTSPAQVRAWRRERIGYCVASLLRDPAVARAVAECVAAARCQDATAQAVPADAVGVPQSRVFWLDRAVRRG